MTRSGKPVKVIPLPAAATPPASAAPQAAPVDTSSPLPLPRESGTPGPRVPRNSVRIFLADAPRTPFTLGFTGPFALYSNDQKNGILDTPCQATLHQNTLRLNGQSLPLPIRLIPLSEAALFRFDGRTYSGNLLVRTDSTGKPILVNELPMESYLKGVLPYEIGKRDSTCFEALKAQAVVARTYSYARLNRHESSGFDLYPDESDQVYRGIEGRYPLSDAAVDATRNLVLTHADTLIQTYYFSTSPCKTANIEEVWPDKGFRPYLRSVNDSRYNTSSKYFTWQEEWTGAELEKIINRFGRETFANFQPGTLNDLRILDRAECGRTKTTLIVLSGREYRVNGDRVRFVLRRPEKNNPILRSAFFTLDIKRTVTGKIKSVIALGGGFGHGVGLSQIGAVQMSQSGMTFTRILDTYYADTRLQQVNP